MTTLNSGWNADYQHRIMTEARRQQALAAAETFGAAYAAVKNFFKSAASSIVRAVVQARQMAELSRLSDRQLADIGIKRSDIPRVVVGYPVAEDGHVVSGLKGWQPSKASNDWHGTAAA